MRVLGACLAPTEAGGARLSGRQADKGGVKVLSACSNAPKHALGVRPRASPKRPGIAEIRGRHGREGAHPAADEAQAPQRGDTSAFEDGSPGISQKAQASHLGKCVLAGSLYLAQPHLNADVSPLGTAQPFTAPLKAPRSHGVSSETRKAPPRTCRNGAFVRR